MRYLLLALCFAFAGCDYNRFAALEAEPAPLWEPTTTIAELKLGEVRGSTIVRGVVITSDSTGNFYKEFLVADPTQGVALRVKAGVYELYTIYNIGAEVLIELRGSEIVLEDGVLSARLASNLSVLARGVQLTGLVSVLQPIRTTVDRLADLAAGSFVELEGVYFRDAGFRSFAGVSVLQELNGAGSVNLYTSPYALFANDALPSGVLTFRGILFFVNGKVQLKMN